MFELKKGEIFTGVLLVALVFALVGCGQRAPLDPVKGKVEDSASY